MIKKSFMKNRNTLDHEGLESLLLIERMGLAGYGLLKVLEHYCNESEDGRVSLDHLPTIAKLVHVTEAFIERLINEFRFFKKDEKEGTFYMTAGCGREAKEKIVKNKCRKAGMKSAEKRLEKAKAAKRENSLGEAPSETLPQSRNVTRHVAESVGKVVENVVEKVVQPDEKAGSLITTTTTSKKSQKKKTVADSLSADDDFWKESVRMEQNLATWTEQLNRVLEDESCLELCGFQYGNAREWKENLPLIKQFFRNHVGIYKDLNAKARYEEAKKYLRNCVKHGGPVWEMVQEQLRSKSQDDPYRFEQRDPDTGERFCYGVPIPDEAPPRPNDNVFWNVEKGAWL